MKRAEASDIATLIGKVTKPVLSQALRGRLTRTEASEATRVLVAARKARVGIEVWEHVGGTTYAPPRGTCIVRPANRPAPRRYWRQVDTVNPPKGGG